MAHFKKKKLPKQTEQGKENSALLFQFNIII